MFAFSLPSMSSSQGASSTTGSEGEKQVKFSLPKTGVGKVFSRSCSTAGVFNHSSSSNKSGGIVTLNPNSQPPQPLSSCMSDRSYLTEKHELNDIPEDAVSAKDMSLD